MPPSPVKPPQPKPPIAAPVKPQPKPPIVSPIKPQPKPPIAAPVKPQPKPVIASPIKALSPISLASVNKAAGKKEAPLESFSQWMKHTGNGQDVLGSKYHRRAPGMMHDIDGTTKDVVKPFRPGTVTFSGWEPGFGWTVRIQDKNGYFHQYSHLDNKSALKGGQKVDVNTTIGNIGNTGDCWDMSGKNLVGRTTPEMKKPHEPGSHLHYDVAYIDKKTHKMVYVDPAKL
jgi:hypothetical protein